MSKTKTVISIDKPTPALGQLAFRGNEQWFTFGFNVYILQTFVTNGGTIKITANEGNLEIYDIQYLITRIHRGR